jgi:sulfatase maturation enzyme AslB (radical SAM superfamily)
VTGGGITLLWALRSPCDLGCRYCYFGTVEEHRDGPDLPAGQLSHLSRADLEAGEVLAFAATLAGSRVQRVFLAGGEPLRWPPVLSLIRLIKTAGPQVILCTNGITLNRPEITQELVGAGVDAVSVSLDSADPVYNDTWRPARNRKDGWNQVISGITALLRARGQQERPRVGVYSVITRLNIGDILAVPQFAAGLGCDYAVAQPVALDPGHPLHGQLSLTIADAPAVTTAFGRLAASGLPVAVPAAPYASLVEAALTAPTGTVRGCFGGSTLAFIEPDGSIWDCPSSLRIAATPRARHASIRGADARALFAAPPPCSDCALFSADCVNMWPLMDFGRLLDGARPGSS